MLGVVAGLLMGEGFGAVADLPAFDFRTLRGVSGWQSLHDLQPLTRDAEGLVATISGPDPYLAGPPRDYPAGQLLWLNLRLRSEAGGTCQVFYFRDGTGPTERDSVRFSVRAGAWVTARVPLEPLGAGYRLRLDPPGSSGRCVFEQLWFEERHLFAAPDWPKPTEPALESGDPALISGDLRLVHSRSRFGGFAVWVAGERQAFGQQQPWVGYLHEGQPRWWAFADDGELSVESAEDRLTVTLAATDPDEGQWRFRQVFRPGGLAGTLSTETTWSVDRERAVLFFPPLTLFSGAGTFGTNKQQAILAGVEYLEDEPSSSEADLEGAQARRQVTDTARLTFPLAAVVAEDRYVGLIWEPLPEVSVVFDTPDRLFRSGGHVLGLLIPGSDGVTREEGSLVPYDAWRLEANQPMTVRAWIIGGSGSNAVTPVRHYVALKGLPAVPATGYASGEYFGLAASGWLDSEIRDGDRYRHAVGGGSFGAQPAADAAVWMYWLAGRVADASLATRLRSSAGAALREVPVGQRFLSGVGHVRRPVAPLAFGGVAENADSALGLGRGLLSRFTGDGTVRYVPSPGGPDYGRTHWTNEANGLTTQVVASLLGAASFAGDSSLTESGLRHLRALKKFRGGVPRGAQTWEIPLHTPDILASAHLVEAYVLGYELTGDAELLDEARYWAWTGVPFVYLRAPVDGPVGPYATIPVLGATQWVAPNWIGLPVQWCGLVYADALYQLGRHDPEGPWRQIAEGIAASGVQQTYPASDRAYLGLLPDSFSLRPQQRNPANINPATLLATATRLFGAGPFYDRWVFRHHGVVAHAAGEILDAREETDAFSFRLRAWPAGRHFVYLNGLAAEPAVRIDGQAVALGLPHVFSKASGRLILQVEGSPRIEVRHPARTALRVERLEGRSAVLSWPAPSMMELQTSPRLGDAAEWRPVESAPIGGGGWLRVTVPTDAEALAVFRLRAPRG